MRLQTFRALGVIWILAGIALMPLVGRAEVIDRVLAVVAGDLILQSDVAAAQDLGLVSVPNGPESTRQVLSRLIDRALILSEVERYAPPEPESAAVDRRLDSVRARSSSPQAFAAVLARAGIDEQHVRETLRQDLRIDAYLEQRFVTATADDEELGRYYRDHQSLFMGTSGPLPFGVARSDVARALASERRSALVSEWVAGLRRRAEIIDLSQER
jgi:hypothetical protein